LQEVISLLQFPVYDFALSVVEQAVQTGNNTEAFDVSLKVPALQLLPKY